MLTFTHALNPLLMIALPLVLGVWITRRFKLRWAIFGWGALTFVVSQVLHIPFNQFLLNPLLVNLGFPEQPVGLALGSLLLGLSAGFFEELARFVFLRCWVREVRSWCSGLLYGAGHGGAEAVILGALTLYGFVQAVALRGVDLTQVLEPGQVAVTQRQLEVYWTMSPALALLGAVERVFALVVQMSAALMVVASVVRGKRRWLVAAILWHTLVDAVAVYLMQRIDVYTAEVAVFFTAVLGLVFILWSCSSGLMPVKFTGKHTDSSMRSGSARVKYQPDKEVTQEDIDSSRYV